MGQNGNGDSNSHSFPSIERRARSTLRSPPITAEVKQGPHGRSYGQAPLEMHLKPQATKLSEFTSLPLLRDLCEHILGRPSYPPDFYLSSHRGPFLFVTVSGPNRGCLARPDITLAEPRRGLAERGSGPRNTQHQQHEKKKERKKKPLQLQCRTEAATAAIA